MGDNLLEKMLDEVLVDFVESGSAKREIYFYAEDLPSVSLPKGKLVKVTLEYDSLAKVLNTTE